MSVEIRLSRADRIYRKGETVSGAVVIATKGAMTHKGISLEMSGLVTMQLSPRVVGVFEAFYNSLKPIKLVDFRIEVAKPGKVPDGVTELPFEFRLEPLADQQLFETYHGVYVNVQYTIQCDVLRGAFSKNLQKQTEFIVESPTKLNKELLSHQFTITPEDLNNVKKNTLSRITNFKISGQIDSQVCDIAKPLTGFLTVDSCDAAIRSIELQLIRVETCGCADGHAKEPTEIQNIQICDGNVTRGVKIPIFMVFPRLFTCITSSARNFKIEFEVNIVVMFEDHHLVSYNLPIEIVRCSQVSNPF